MSRYGWKNLIVVRITSLWFIPVIAHTLLRVSRSCSVSLTRVSPMRFLGAGGRGLIGERFGSLGSRALNCSIGVRHPLE